MLSLTRQLNYRQEKYVVHLLGPLIKSNFRVPARGQRNGVAHLVEALRYKSEGPEFGSC